MTAIVLVHTGRRRAPALKAAIKQIQTYLPGLPIYLLSELRMSSQFKAQGISLIDLKDIGEPDALEDLKDMASFKNNFRDHFWFRVLSRHLYMAQFASKMPDDDWLHFENDCLSLITPEILEEIRAANRGVAVPFESRGRAIPVVVHVTSKDAFKNLVEGLLSASRNYPDLLDMDLWAAAASANPSLFTPLPTMLDATWTRTPPPILPTEQREFVPSNWQWKEAGKFSAIFDAAALGQFLGGRDPSNQNFRMRPGHEHETSWLDVARLRWRLNRGLPTDLPKLEVSMDGSTWVSVANLHMHSKRIPAMIPLSQEWTRSLAVANRQIPPWDSFAWARLAYELMDAPGEGPRVIADLIYTKTKGRNKPSNTNW